MSEARLDEYKEQFKKHLTKEGKKWTRQRWAMAKLILKTADHMDAQEIVERVRKHDSKIGIATVYRNIKVLCEAGILELTHHDAGGRNHYEIHEKGAHDHIICMDCGAILEFHDAKIETLQKKAATKMGFTIHDHRNVIHAHCKLLKKK